MLPSPSPAPAPPPDQRSKPRAIMRLLSTKLAPRPLSTVLPRTAPPVPAVSAADRRNAALRERGLLPPLPARDHSAQERDQDAAIPVVDTAPPADGVSAADLIKREWEERNNADPADRMRQFRFGAATSEPTADSTSDLPEPKLSPRPLPSPHSLPLPSPPPTYALPPIPSAKPDPATLPLPPSPAPTASDDPEEPDTSLLTDLQPLGTTTPRTASGAEVSPAQIDIGTPRPKQSTHPDPDELALALQVPAREQELAKDTPLEDQVGEQEQEQAGDTTPHHSLRTPPPHTSRGRSAPPAHPAPAAPAPLRALPQIPSGASTPTNAGAATPTQASVAPTPTLTPVPVLYPAPTLASPLSPDADLTISVNAPTPPDSPPRAKNPKGKFGALSVQTRPLPVRPVVVAAPSVAKAEFAVVEEVKQKPVDVISEDDDVHDAGLASLAGGWLAAVAAENGEDSAPEPSTLAPLAEEDPLAPVAEEEDDTTDVAQYIFAPPGAAVPESPHSGASLRASDVPGSPVSSASGAASLTSPVSSALTSATTPSVSPSSPRRARPAAPAPRTFNPFKRSSSAAPATDAPVRRMSVAAYLRRSVTSGGTAKNGELQRSKTKRVVPPSPTVPGLPSTNAPLSPRQAVAPVLYTNGGILAEAAAIEDDETRRRTELAFL